MSVAVDVGRKGRLVLEIIQRAQDEGRSPTEYGVWQATGFKPRRFHHVLSYLRWHGFVDKRSVTLTDAGREAIR